MPRETTNRRAVLDAIDSVDSISELTSRDNGHYIHELDLEVSVYGRNYNGKRVGPYIKLLTYEPGEAIVNQGDWGGNSFYVMVRGIAEVFVMTGQGQVRVREIARGAQFGEMSVLAGVPRGATVRASQTGAAEVLEITRPALRLLRKLPKFSAMLDSEYRRNGRSATLISLKSNTSLTPELISDLEGISRFRVFSKGHTLFRERTPIDHIFLVNAGWARLTSGSRSTESYAGAMSCFGLEALEGASNWARTCILQARSEVLEISIAKLRQLPELREALGDQLASMSPPALTKDYQFARPVIASQQRLVETGLADATNLLVMDMDLCIRCGNCSLACHKVHGQTRLVRRGLHVARLRSAPEPAGPVQSLLAPAVCLHCQDPECLTGCPTGAIQRLPGGEVDIDAKTCIGCGDCAAQCPYNAISMVPRRSAGAFVTLSAGQELFSLGAEPLPPAVEQTEDLLAVKCNLCANTPLNPDKTATQAYSCEENCPTGALLRVTPNEYFPEIRILEGRRLVRSGMGASLRRTVKDHSLRFTHLLGVALTILLSVLAAASVLRSGLEKPLIGSWLNLRWITGIGGLLCVLIVMAYPLRRRIYRRRAGPLRYWLLLQCLFRSNRCSCVARPCAGTRSGGALTTVLTVSFDLVILTGLFGIACYYTVPRLLTRIEEQPLLIEDLEARREELRTRLADVTASAPDSVRDQVTSTLFRRFLSAGYLVRQLVSRRSLEEAYSQEIHLLEPRMAQLPNESREVLTTIARDLITLRRVEALIILHRLLKAWVVPHVLTTALMLALLVMHIIQVIYFAAR